MKKKILDALEKFDLNLSEKLVLTEAATGNFVVTPIIAALAGAKVYAYTKDSKYGSVDEVKKQTYKLAKEFHIENKINIIRSLENVPFLELDIVTNTGFLRPINREFITKLSNKCVIPLMWEPWEFRSNELDINSCKFKGIKVYGTNESDERLRTIDYIGLISLYWLLHSKKSPYSSNVLVLGSEKFVNPIIIALEKNGYRYKAMIDYNSNVNLDDFNCIIVAEYSSARIVIGDKKKEAFINKNDIKERLILHISGNIELQDYTNCIPREPKPFPYMSFTTDFIDNKAVIDLHSAGLKVAEGMLKANRMDLDPVNYRCFMEHNYPALAFNDQKYW